MGGGRGAGQRDAMFALMARAAHPQATEQLFLKNGMSEAAIRDHEIQKNSDMIDFCTTTYSSIRNREYCIDKFVKPQFNYLTCERSIARTVAVASCEGQALSRQ